MRGALLQSAYFWIAEWKYRWVVDDAVLEAIGSRRDGWLRGSPMPWPREIR